MSQSESHWLRHNVASCSDSSSSLGFQDDGHPSYRVADLIKGCIEHFCEANGDIAANPCFPTHDFEASSSVFDRVRISKAKNSCDAIIADYEHLAKGTALSPIPKKYNSRRAYPLQYDRSLACTRRIPVPARVGLYHQQATLPTKAT
jgi:hypothetical protein